MTAQSSWRRVEYFDARMEPTNPLFRWREIGLIKSLRFIAGQVALFDAPLV